MKSLPRSFLIVLLFAHVTWTPVVRSQSTLQESEGLEFFEQKVRPLLLQRCYSCHSIESGKSKGGLNLDSRESILAGGDNGPAAVSGDLDGSLLIDAIRYGESSFQMPPDGKLPDREIAILEEWVRRRLPFTSRKKAEAAQRTIDIEAGRKHWAFQPLRSWPLPPLDSHLWPQRRIDNFILAAQQQKQLGPAPPAGRASLLRRAKLDLLGLQPTAEEVNDFIADASPDAFARRIESWLSSAHYGERWGRFWLDLVRYCDIPEVWSEVKANPHQYRDWVIRSVNDDLPYDRFVRLQLAADLMDDAAAHDRAALGMLGLSPSYWKELQLPVEIIKSIVSDEYEERVHTFSSTFLGLNMACARCHDHKFDPITIQDYYALAGVFANTRLTDRAIVSGIDDVAVIQAREQVTKLEAELKKLTVAASNTKKKADQSNSNHSVATEADTKVAELQAKIARLKGSAGYDSPMAPGARDAFLTVLEAEGTHGSRIIYRDQIQDIPLEIRGNPNKPGEAIPRRFVTVLSREAPSKFSKGSGRLELANSLFSQSPALVARVFVNRVWKHHFGVGIVDTTSDFGTQGDRPTHPELLDDLAFRFVQNGWSLKWLHREIMLSATYQQSSGPTPPDDADYRYYTRFKRRQLDVEAWRDTILSAAGNLDSNIGGPAQELSEPANYKRTIYGTVRRRELSDLLRLYDFPDPITHSPNRVPTITPLQQLYTLNSPFMYAQSVALVELLNRHCGSDHIRRIQMAYQRILSRLPQDRELRLAMDFVQSGQPSVWPEFVQVLLGSNEMMFVD